MNPDNPPAAPEQTSEMLILPDGKIFVHNLTPAIARLLIELDPADAAMLRRAGIASPDFCFLLPPYDTRFFH